MELHTNRPMLAKELFNASEILRTIATTDEEDGTPGLVFVVARLGVERARQLESAIYCELVLDETHAVLNLVTCDGWLRAVTELRPDLLHTVEALLDDHNPEILLGLIGLTDSAFVAPIRRRVVVRDYSSAPPHEPAELPALQIEC